MVKGKCSRKLNDTSELVSFQNQVPSFRGLTSRSQAQGGRGVSYESDLYQSAHVSLSLQTQRTFRGESKKCKHEEGAWSKETAHSPDVLVSSVSSSCLRTLYFISQVNSHNKGIKMDRMKTSSFGRTNLKYIHKIVG